MVVKSKSECLYFLVKIESMFSYQNKTRAHIPHGSWFMVHSQQKNNSQFLGADGMNRAKVS